MDKFVYVEILPIQRFPDMLEGIREYAQILEKSCGFSNGEERDSAHYIEETYFKWHFQNCSIKFFWCDESGFQDWFGIAINCEEENAIDLAHKICNNLTPFIKDYRIR
ncbi:MAG: hypothetical protein JW902_08065 [Syntrophaceae bacterium]|nr:hypothetical protein [Syntrophaceae bacterium]